VQSGKTGARKMKKVLAIIGIVVMLVLLVGCGSGLSKSQLDQVRTAIVSEQEATGATVTGDLEYQGQNGTLYGYTITVHDPSAAEYGFPVDYTLDVIINSTDLSFIDMPDFLIYPEKYPDIAPFTD
jgi:hypothetical protein